MAVIFWTVCCSADNGDPIARLEWRERNGREGIGAMIGVGQPVSGAVKGLVLQNNVHLQRLVLY